MEQRKKCYYHCSVNGCLNSTLNCDLSFFKLPVILDNRQEWLKLICREDLIDSTCLRARVCEAHFSPDCISITASRKLLKKKSIPQLLLPLQEISANKETQTSTVMANASVQCYYGFQTNSQTQTPLHLLYDSPGNRKLLNEIQTCRKRLKMTNEIKKYKPSTAQSEANTFYKLCDKFLSKKLACIVKKRMKIKTPT